MSMLLFGVIGEHKKNSQSHAVGYLKLVLDMLTASMKIPFVLSVHSYMTVLSMNWFWQGLIYMLTREKCNLKEKFHSFASQWKLSSVNWMKNNLKTRRIIYFHLHAERKLEKSKVHQMNLSSLVTLSWL